MNDQSANRMLKTLEEPPPFAHLILLTDRLGEVLPTIASRCQLVRFDARPPAALAQKLARHGIPEPTATACARLALATATWRSRWPPPTARQSATPPRSSCARA